MPFRHCFKWFVTESDPGRQGLTPNFYMSLDSGKKHSGGANTRIKWIYLSLLISESTCRNLKIHHEDDDDVQLQEETYSHRAVRVLGISISL